MILQNYQNDMIAPLPFWVTGFCLKCEYRMVQNKKFLPLEYNSI